jgi:hypothetical protein
MSNSKLTGLVVPPNKLRPGELSRHVLDCLETFKPTRKFATNEPLKDMPNPHLLLYGFGCIEFPLSEHDINKIKRASGQQGTKEEEMPNSSLPLLRNVWEVPGNLWTASNPSWNDRRNFIIPKVYEALGINGSMGNLSKQSTLVLYETSSVVEPSQM